jgi:hypothetical protein
MLVDNLLEIKLDPKKSTMVNNGDIEVTIDQQPISHKLVDSTIVINANIDFGIHILRIKSKSDIKLEIVDVFFNRVGIRSALYLSWVEDAGNKHQPCTCLWSSGQEWVLPFGNPMSQWLSKTYEKLSAFGLNHGDNLFEKCDIFYPEPAVIDKKFPQLVQDFFRYDFDFTVIEKNPNNLKSLPYKVIDLGNHMDTTTDVYNEVISRYDQLAQVKKIPAQVQYNLKEDPTISNSHWFTHYVISRSKSTDKSDWTADIEYFPKLKKFIELFDLQDIYCAFVGITIGNSYAAPHIDSLRNTDPKYQPYKGCGQLYIPITPNDASLFKIAGVGIIPSNTAVLLNNEEFVHGLVNDQSCLRVNVGIKFNIQKNLHLFK